jgi:hypothetical protein
VDAVRGLRDKAVSEVEGFDRLPGLEQRNVQQTALEKALREYVATPEGKAELAAWVKARKQAAKFAR